MSEEEQQTDHSQQVTSGRQSAVVRNLHSVSSQVRQLRVVHNHLEMTTQTRQVRKEAANLY